MCIISRAVVEGRGWWNYIPQQRISFVFVCTFLPQNLHLWSMQDRVFFFFFFFLHFTGRETWAEKKIMLLNGFPKMPKTANPKTVATSLFIFPAKNCWLLTLFPIGEISTSFLSSKILASHFKTEYNFKHAKSGSSHNCKYIKITDRVKADGDSKRPGSFIHLFVPLVMQQTFTGSFIYWVQTFIGCSGLSWLSGI